MQSLASCAFGGMLFALIHYLRKRRKTCTSKNNDNQDTSLDLLREQLKRNYEYFGEEGMKLIANSHVCVVGIGGVGR